MGKTYIWGVAIIVGVVGAVLIAMVFGLLPASIFTLIMTPVLLAAFTYFHQARVARRERNIIKKMVEAATTAEGRPGNDNAMKQAAE
jgi:hypothetical protein